MKKLIIAEKPYAAQAIAKVLNAYEKKSGYTENEDYIISWCIGHLLGLADPENYDEKYRKWTVSSLPIIPEKWLYKVNESSKTQFNILKGLMQRNDISSLVCATEVG